MLLPEDLVAVWIMQIWVAFAAPWFMVTSGPKLLVMTMSGSVVLQQLWSVLMSVACVTTC